MTRCTEEYREAMAKAKIIPNTKHAFVRYKEERKKRIVTPIASHPPAATSVGVFSSGESSEEEAFSESKCPFDEPRNLEGNTEHSVITKFGLWLQSPDGGKRDNKTAKQHSSQLWNMLKIIDEKCDVNFLLDLTLIRDIFLKIHVDEKKYEGATIKSYLMKLRHYFTFLLSDSPNEVDFNIDDVRAAGEKVRMWSASYKRESCTRRWQKMEEDASNVLTPANIQAFEKSEAVRNAVKLIGQYSDPVERTPVTQSDYTLVRDFLFAQIFIDNANRPGVLSYMTMKELENMREEGSDCVIAVRQHKTVDVHGPADVVLSQKLASWLSVYVNTMRSQVSTSKHGPVFLSWNGQRMTSGQINKAVQSVFKKAGMATKVRRHHSGKPQLPPYMKTTLS